MLSAAQFQFVRTLIYRDAGIVLNDNKGYLVQTRLESVARAASIDGVGALIDQMTRKPDRDLSAAVIEAITTNETSFFRDTSCFGALSEDILPALVRARAGSRSLRIWSAACSTGQEIYSVLMLLFDQFPQTRGWDVRAYGTDLNTQVLARAKEGVYKRLEVNRGLPARHLVKYTEQRGLRWHIAEDLRRRVTFQQMNLVKSWPPLPTFDLILLRNVMIYFDVNTRVQILRRVRDRLAPDGCLLLGTAESGSIPEADFDRVRGTGHLYFQPSRAKIA